MEWSNPYNSFNSMKGLTYYQNYRNVLAWMDGKEKLGPPIEVNLDPVAECNLDCYFCVGQRYLKWDRQEVGPMRKLDKEYMLRLVDFLAKWGVKGLCISGGGEPTLHADLPMIIRYAAQYMDVAVVTNATLGYQDLDEALMKCRWVALSIDAADAEVYEKVKGRDRFNEVICNAMSLANLKEKTGSKVDLCFKFLVLPENQHQIYDACRLAKGMGVQDFHARPADFERSDIKGHKKLSIDTLLVAEQFRLCHDIGTEDFHVYTVTHKFDAGFHVRHDFTACLATPLVLPLLSDGNAYLCVDKKMESAFRLGAAYPDPREILNWWGSDQHRDLIKSVNIDNCSRCTWGPYNRQCEEVVMKDKMCVSFP